MQLGRLLWLVRPGAGRGDLAAQEPAVYLRRWAAWLSLPSTEVLMRHDHVVLQEDGELVASGFLLPRRASPPDPD